ncbi:MAG: divalent-cation tolerance protein CutA [Deltaproteobacteria bacterium]
MATTNRPMMVVMTTVASVAEAEAMTVVLLEEGLAACVSRLQVSSSYHWQGALEEKAEWLLLIKSAADLWPELSARVQALHAYEVPEIVRIEADGASGGYMDWLAGACRAPTV